MSRPERLLICSFTAILIEAASGRPNGSLDGVLPISKSDRWHVRRQKMQHRHASAHANKRPAPWPIGAAHRYLQALHYSDSKPEGSRSTPKMATVLQLALQPAAARQAAPTRSSSRVVAFVAQPAPARRTQLSRRSGSSKQQQRRGALLVAAAAQAEVRRVGGPGGGAVVPAGGAPPLPPSAFCRPLGCLFAQPCSPALCSQLPGGQADQQGGDPRLHPPPRPDRPAGALGGWLGVLARVHACKALCSPAVASRVCVPCTNC